MKAPAVPEAAIQAAVIDHWKKFGLPNTLVAAIPNQRAHGQPGLTPGLFDLLVIGPNVPGKVGFLELKKVGGRLSDKQKDFRALCVANGIWTAVAYGRDEPIACLRSFRIVR